ncbi:hypothetical protein P3X46_026311 [Hevea brasiliensis]|uniref:Uncharacterized protein n=1 Tax=Hevea brasiliensis TaxID=3981 RepID=A0ABQ9KW83_HEVBR|nr:hypothetical protein P3X46_026311 [Hevea brasiliensis]
MVSLNPCGFTVTLALKSGALINPGPTHRDRFRYVNADRGVLVINHYKYQVWEVFKDKFYRRVATYVVDWQNEQNVGSKDRVRGLETRAIEPPDLGQ